MNNADAEGIRLQKVLSQAGIASRRAAEELISRGKVKVNGEPARLGQRVDPAKDIIHVSGKRVATDVDTVYFAINKPRGIISTMDDEEGRPSLSSIAKGIDQRVFHVGRLDTDSEGLLLLTNDGDLANRLTHPSYGVAKTYLAEVPGPVPPAVRRRLLAGVSLEDGPARADAFRVVDALGRRALVELTLHEGRKHIVRRMLAEVGHPVQRLIRTAVGPVKLGDLRSGRWRRLTPTEVAALFAAVD
jgi:23S rRNA pseudouridine2605 synthase